MRRERGEGDEKRGLWRGRGTGGGIMGRGRGHQYCCFRAIKRSMYHTGRGEGEEMTKVKVKEERGMWREMWNGRGTGVGNMGGGATELS